MGEMIWYSPPETSSQQAQGVSNAVNLKHTPDEPMVYQIRIKGHLGAQWADWFGGLTITLEDNSETLLAGPVLDQAALHGLLKRVRDLGIPLISVIRVEPDQADRSTDKQELNGQ